MIEMATTIGKMSESPMSPNAWLHLEYQQQFGCGDVDDKLANLDDFDVFDHDLLVDQINRNTNDNITNEKHLCECGREFHTKIAAITCLASHQDIAIKDTMILDGEKIYPCIKCSYNTNNLANLEKHRAIHANSKAYICDACPYSTQFIHVLEHHKAGHTANRKFKCDKCTYSCNLMEALRRHKAIHQLMEPFSCVQCNFKSVLKDVVVRHKVTHERFRGYTCEECGFHCKNLATYKKHTISHLPTPADIAIIEVKYPKPFQCEHCPMTFARADSLSVHKRTHTGATPYCCEECSYKCRDRYSLKKHIKLIHREATLIKCELCSYTTFYKGDLNKHHLIHKGQRKFQCDQCSFTGLLLGDLRRHQLTHGGERKYKCEHCEYTCTRTDYLKVHTQMHTKPFACSKCEYRTTQARHLKGHMLSHTGEKPFSCNDCDYKTRTAKHLQRHNKYNCRVKKAAQKLIEEDREREINRQIVNEELEKMARENSNLEKEKITQQLCDEDLMLAGSDNEINLHIVEEALTKLMDEGREGEISRQIVNEELSKLLDEDNQQQYEAFEQIYQYYQQEYQQLNQDSQQEYNSIEVHQERQDYQQEYRDYEQDHMSCQQEYQHYQQDYRGSSESVVDQEFIEFIENDVESREILAEEIMKLILAGKEDDAIRQWMNEELMRMIAEEGLREGNKIMADKKLVSEFSFILQNDCPLASK